MKPSKKRQFVDRNEAVNQYESALRKCRIVAELVGFLSGLNIDLISATRGTSRAAFARQIAMYLSNTVIGLRLGQVSTAYNRERSMAPYSARKIEDLRDDPEFDQLLDEVSELLGRILEIKERFHSKITAPKFIKSKF